MRHLLTWTGALAALSFAAFAVAAPDPNARVQRLQRSVLAPCCYTESVALHQSEIALKMRFEIARWVNEGRTDQAILDTYVKRYGPQVLIDPNTSPGTWTLLVPWAVMILGTLGVVRILWRWRMATASRETAGA